MALVVALRCPYCTAEVHSEVAECAHCGSALELPVSLGDLVDGRFEARAILGFGALGTTYAVRDRVEGRDVLLKVLSPALVPTDQEREALGHQLEMFAGRPMAGSALPIEVGLTDELLYAIYTPVESVSLRELIEARSAQSPAFSPEESLRLLLAILSAISALHSATPHGALRPENVLITPTGVVLTNGAILGAVPPERLQPRLRAFAQAVTYVAPEVIAGKKVTATADLFALGAIAAELLTGSPTAHGLEEAGLSPEVCKAIRQLLERDRTKRPGGQGTLMTQLAKSCGLERRPMDVAQPIPEVPPPTEDSEGGQTTVAAPRASISATPKRESLPPMPGAVPNAASPNLTSTQPSLPSARGPMGRPLGSGGLMLPSMPGAPPRSSPPMPSVPEPSAATPIAGPPAPQRPMTARSSVPAMPAVPVARPSPAVQIGQRGQVSAPRPSRPPSPSPSPVIARTGLPVGVPAMPAAPAPSPRMPRIPSLSAPAARPTSRDVDGIDPRLLEAADEMDADRRNREFADVDTGEIELLDE
ncbi:MAG: protein kinase [Deltaproteobacteria bacterium]|nr:protein kinase [Deltaproteobacteria bacterium]